MILKPWCGHFTEEGTLYYREFCKGCGEHPKDDTEEAWDIFLATFEEAEEGEY